jgi:probable F420-dependent oxidoreductase
LLEEIAMPRAFRFGVQCWLAASRSEWQAKARRVEALGYQVFLVPDHFGEQFAPAPALLSAAEATRSIRIGSLVYDNDFRNPALLAKEAATLDLLADGRFEFGIGAGWMRSEYEQAGLAFEPGPTRVARLEEAIPLIRSIWRGGPASYEGKHYRLAGLESAPLPAQRPGPPLLIGGGGPRILRLAAREADIVGLVLRSRADGNGLDLGDLSSAALDDKVRWVREAAGPRFAALELSTLLQTIAITSDRLDAAARLAKSFGVPSDAVLDTPYALIGSAAEIETLLRERRERFGLSYYVLFERDMEAFAPIAARLAGA